MTCFLVIDCSRRSDSGERRELESGWRADEKKGGETRKLFFAAFARSERLGQASLILAFSLLGVRGS